MKTYVVMAAWDHLGNRYPKTAEVRVKATSLPTAVQRGLREIKRLNPKSLRETVGTKWRIYVTLLGEEVRDVRAENDQADEQEGA